MVFQVSNLEQAVGLIEEMRLKFRTQGQQVIAYRRKLRQQVEKRFSNFNTKASSIEAQQFQANARTDWPQLKRSSKSKNDFQEMH